MSSVLALSAYIGLSFIWDLIIKGSDAVSGKFPRVITAILTSGIQFAFLNWQPQLLLKAFKLQLLKNNYSYWAATSLYPKSKRALFGLKFTVAGVCLLGFLSSLFIFALGCGLSSEAIKNSTGVDYYFDKWYALAGAVLLPTLRAFTSLVYIPNWSYRLFFRI
ncbi:hypothetical protein [Candidatus Mycoplasma haematominutum]|nr:hypothetical protein [Candidatus Mycoplasma haematominutum]